MADLSIDGEIFNVEVEGEAAKPALVLLHALGTTLDLWDPQMPSLLRHFRVIRYDSRGHGGSAEGLTPYSIARLGRDALAILDALEIERAHILGLSMGGAVGQWLLVHAPDRIERAVLANTAARLGAPQIWNARIRSALAGAMDAIAETTIERWFGDTFRTTHADTMDAFETTLRTMSPTAYAASCAALRDMDLRHALRGVSHPVLVVSGTEDPAILAADVAGLTDALSDAEHVALPCRHIANIEAADAFTGQVVRFLTGRVPVRAKQGAPGAIGTKARRPRSIGAGRTTARAKAAGKPSVRPVADDTRRTAVGGRRPASASRNAKTQPAVARTRKAVAAGTAAPARRSSRSTADAPRAPARTAKAAVKTATRVIAKTLRAKPASSKSAPDAPARGVPTRTSGRMEVAPSRRATPSASARAAPTAKKVPNKAPTKAASKTASPKATAKAPRKGAGTKLPAPRRSSPAASGRPAGRGGGRGAGRGKGRGKS